MHRAFCLIKEKCDTLLIMYVKIDTSTAWLTHVQIAADPKEEDVGDDEGWDHVVEEVGEPQLRQGHQLLVPGQVLGGRAVGHGRDVQIRLLLLHGLLGKGPEEKPVR